MPASNKQCQERFWTMWRKSGSVKKRIRTMRCKGVSGAIPPSPYADTRVEVTDCVYKLTEITNTIKVCCPELIGQDLRIILGKHRHFRSPEYETVTPASAYYAMFCGVPSNILEKV